VTCMCFLVNTKEFRKIQRKIFPLLPFAIWPYFGNMANGHWQYGQYGNMGNGHWTCGYMDFMTGKMGVSGKSIKNEAIW
jgi:hypothetical protein